MDLKSTLFKLKFLTNEKGEENKNANFYLLISGIGSGHGVGMSQWGARNMAERGYKAKDILEYYYKDTKIKPFKEIYK